MSRRLFMKSTAIAVSTLALAMAGGQAHSQTPTTYTIAGMVDYVGMYADAAAPIIGGREAVIRWWNAEVGKGLGVELKVKNFDTRSDAAQTASLWPSVKAENPVAILALGGNDTVVLKDRIKEAQIPAFLGSSVVPVLWDNGWYFSLRPFYAQEFGVFFDAHYKAVNRTTPFKVAVVSSESVPVYVDIMNGMIAYGKQFNRITVDPVWAPAQPTDLTTQIQRAVKAGAEYIVVPTNTAAVVAAQRALQSLGSNIPLVLSNHNGLAASGKALNDLKSLENSYEVHTFPMPVGDTVPKKFFDTLVAKYALKGDWNTLTAQGITQGLLAVRGMEMAVKKYGPTKLDGIKVREALLSDTVKLGFGYAADAKLDPKSAFAIGGMTANVVMIKDGSYVMKYPDALVPVMTRW